MSLPEGTEYYTPGAEDHDPAAASTMIAVESPLDFARVVRYDLYQLMLDRDIVFAHGPCGGGSMRVDPPAFVETRRGKLKRVETEPDDPIALICNECDARFEGFTRHHFQTVLTRFLARPRPSALETYRLSAEVSFVDPEWKPHQRRRRPDRRAEETRYEVDPSLMGRRRMGRDRRRDPEVRDVPPEPEQP
jgi:hypothetical protein